MKFMPILFVTGSALIDIAANMMVAKSQGFRRLGWGLGAIVLVWTAFALLGQAVKSMDLSIAYAMWGAIGITGTALFSRILFGHRLRPIGWLGIVLIATAVAVLSTA